MPYDGIERNMRESDGNQTFRGPGGHCAGVTHLRLRDQWSAWTRDASGHYEHEVCDTREQALDALRRKGAWDGLPTP